MRGSPTTVKRPSRWNLEAAPVQASRRASAHRSPTLRSRLSRTDVSSSARQPSGHTQTPSERQPRTRDSPTTFH